MKAIPLTQGQVALVDDEDFEWLNRWKWYALDRGRTFHARRTVRIGEKRNAKNVWMHREILRTPQGMYTDHKDCNGLNNQKSNLRACTSRESAMNRRASVKTTSHLKGAKYKKESNRWNAGIMVNKKSIWLGSFDTQDEAHQAYIVAAYKYHGEFANIDIVIGGTT